MRSFLSAFVVAFALSPTASKSMPLVSGSLRLVSDGVYDLTVRSNSRWRIAVLTHPAAYSLRLFDVRGEPLLEDDNADEEQQYEVLAGDWRLLGPGEAVTVRLGVAPTAAVAPYSAVCIGRGREVVADIPARVPLSGARIRWLDRTPALRLRPGGALPQPIRRRTVAVGVPVRGQMQDAAQSDQELCRAAATADVRRLRRLLLSGVDPNVSDQHGLVPLAYAATGGVVDKLEPVLLGRYEADRRVAACALLLRHGASPWVGCPDETVAQISFRCSDDRVAAALIAGSAPPPEVMHAVQQQVAVAAALSRVRELEALLKCGASARGGGSGDSPLHRACGSGSVPCVRMLIDAGADLNARDKDGRSPLETAVRAGRTEVVRLLLSRHVDARQPDREGVTPVMWAHTLGRTTIERILRGAGGAK